MDKRKRRSWLVSAIGLAALLAAPPQACAQSARTFVSGLGTDSGTCGRTAPCRSFAYAISQTASAGEIVVLDSAGYGSVTIGQSLTITNPGGVEAGISATSGATAVTINAMTPSNVTLRGLTLEGGGVGATGIDYAAVVPPAAQAPASAGTLSIVDCVVKDFTGTGTFIAPTISNGQGSVPTLSVLISGTLSLHNGDNGLAFDPAFIYVLASVDDSTFSDNSTGVRSTVAESTSNSVNLSFVNSHADRNTGVGIDLIADVTLIMKNSTALYNDFNAGQDVVVNSATVPNRIYLLNTNAVGGLYIASGTTVTGYTDGTNNILSLTGTLTKINPQ